MKVKDLLEFLEKCPHDSEVVFFPQFPSFSPVGYSECLSLIDVVLSLQSSNVLLIGTQPFSANDFLSPVESKFGIKITNKDNYEKKC